MTPRTTVAVGLVSGAAVAVAVLLAAVVLIPDPAPITAATAAPSPTDGGPDGGSPGPTSGGSPSAEPTVDPSAGEPRFHVGETAPPLSVRQVGGGEIDLANLDGRPVWINFTQTTSPASEDEFPLMSDFAVRYADAGLVVIAIDLREDEGTVAAFAQRLNATFPIGLDEDGAAATAWWAVALPVHFWIDRDGVIRAGALGGLGAEAMAANLATILPGVIVTP